MRPAARRGDLTAHGSALGPGFGATSVLIDGQPAWRASTDRHQCPMGPPGQIHGSGTVVTGSSTVLIEGYPAARMGDTIDEGSATNLIAVGSTTVMIGGGSQPAQPEWATEVFGLLASLRSRFNRWVENAEPGSLAGQFSGEVVNLYVHSEEGEVVTSVAVRDPIRIGELSRGARDDASVRVTTDAATLRRINQSDTPAMELRAAVERDDIRISGIGPVNTVKWTVIDGLRRIGEALGLEQL